MYGGPVAWDETNHYPADLPTQPIESPLVQAQKNPRIRGFSVGSGPRWDALEP
jgi:hypothetical protein